MHLHFHEATNFQSLYVVKVIPAWEIKCSTPFLWKWLIM